MIKINLLPEDLSVNSNVTGISKIFKNITIILLVLFILIGAGLGAFLFFGSKKLTNLQTEVSDVESQIRIQNKAEQSMVLLKDRIAKIKILNSMTSAKQTLNSIDPIISVLPPDVSVGEMSLDSKKIEMSLGFSDPTSLHDFFDSLTGLSGFSVVKLSSFSFNPSTGYLVSLSFWKG